MQKYVTISSIIYFVPNYSLYSSFLYCPQAIVKSLSTAREGGEASLPTYSRELSDPVPGGVEVRVYHLIIYFDAYMIPWTVEFVFFQS